MQSLGDIFCLKNETFLKLSFAVLETKMSGQIDF